MEKDSRQNGGLQTENESGRWSTSDNCRETVVQTEKTVVGFTVLFCLKCTTHHCHSPS